MSNVKISDISTTETSLSNVAFIEGERSSGNTPVKVPIGLITGPHYEGFGNLLSLAALTLLSGASANLTLTNGTKRHLFAWTASGANAIQMAYQAVPATPWDICVRFVVHASMATNVQFGLALRNSTSGKIFFLALNTNTTISCQEWTNPTTFSSSIATAAIATPTHIPFWLRIGNDGTTLTAQYSWNGVDWTTLTTRALATFMSSIDHVGLGCVPQSALSAEVSNFGHTVPS